MRLGFLGSKALFVFVCVYRQLVLADFFVGQAKGKNEGQEMDLTDMFRSLVETRIVVEYGFYRQTDNLAQFWGKWGDINDTARLSW